MAAGTIRTTASETIWPRALEDEGAIASLAADVAALVGPGDLVTLSGGLGAGKTAFARALIRILTGDQDIEVPSPAFTLMQIYEGLNFPIVHADFYRIEKPRDLIELGFDEACDDALVLVEWPERAGDLLDAGRLDIELKSRSGQRSRLPRRDPDWQRSLRNAARARQGDPRASRSQRLERRRAQFHAGRCVGQKL